MYIGLWWFASSGHDGQQRGITALQGQVVEVSPAPSCLRLLAETACVEQVCCEMWRPSVPSALCS